MCPAELGPVFGMAAELVDCDILRMPSLLSTRGFARLDDQLSTAGLSIIKYREYANIIHINFYMPTATYVDKAEAVRWGAEWVFDGADSMLPMGITNDMRNSCPTIMYLLMDISVPYPAGRRMQPVIKGGKTAEDAFRIFKWGYEYQENGMGGMTY